MSSRPQIPWYLREVPFLLTRKQAALLLNVCPRTISRAWASTELMRVQAPGTLGPKGYRVPLASLEAFAKKYGFTWPWMEEGAA